MNFDFSKLEALSETKKASKRSEAQLDSKFTVESSLFDLQHDADIRKIQLERALKINREYLKNKVDSASHIAEIIKGLQEGISIYHLFLKAMSSLSILTNDSNLYEQTRSTLMTVHGFGLKLDDAKELEYDEVLERLRKLKLAYSKEVNLKDRMRIENAIKRHEMMLKHLSE
ncbi:hypothetical protein AB1I63_02525 [Streptococcus pneumoniae]